MDLDKLAIALFLVLGTAQAQYPSFNGTRSRPCGANRQVQYNNAGLCGGASQLLYDNSGNNTDVGPGESVLNALLRGYTGQGKLFLTDVVPDGFPGFAAEVDGSANSGDNWGSFIVILGGTGSTTGSETDTIIGGSGGGGDGVDGFVTVNGNLAVGTLTGMRGQASSAASNLAADTLIGGQFGTVAGSGGGTNARGVDIIAATSTGFTNNHGIKIGNRTGGTNNWAIQTGLGLNEFGDAVLLDGIVFASLGTPTNGTRRYCSDCQVTSSIDDTCTSGGTGANAYRLGGAWKCVQ